MDASMKLKFTAEDFKEAGLIKLWLESEGFADDGVPDRIAAIANARLQEILADAPVVYRRYGENGDIHRAKLVEIEEIKK